MDLEIYIVTLRIVCEIFYHPYFEIDFYHALRRKKNISNYARIVQNFVKICD